MQLTAARDHAAPMLAVTPVMPSAEIMILFNGCVSVTLLIVTAVAVEVESKTTLQLLAYSVPDPTLSVELMIEMPLLAVKVESSNEALHPPFGPLIVVAVMRTDAVNVNELNPIQNPT